MAGSGRRRGLPVWSVRARILAAILLVTVAGLGVTGTVSHLVQRDQVVRDVDGVLEAQVEAARAVVDAQAGEVETSRDALAAILAILPAPADGSVLGIVDGRAALVPGTAIAFDLAGSPLVDRIVREVADGSARIGTAVQGGTEIRYVGVPVVVDGADDAGIYLVAVDLSLALEPTNRGLLTFVVVAGATVLAVGLAGWLVAGRLLRPVRRLRETAERITASDLTERIPVDGDDDLARLTETVNDMLDRIETAVRNQRELVDDVRHELRTPLTITRGHLELVDPADAGDVRRTAALAIEEIDRMAALVDGLTAWAEVRAAVPELRPTDVAVLTRDVAELASAIPAHHWSVAEQAQATVPLDRRLITQAWLQLADNAAKYAPAGSPIELGSRLAGGAAELWVRDHGPGVPAGQETRVFERFARASSGPERGSGLGLAIVARIARAHGGTARVESPGDGARFVLSIPAEVAS
jgi:two-component system, OmpR family, sensor kinase